MIFKCSECESELAFNEEKSVFICTKCGRKREFKHSPKSKIKNINMSDITREYSQVLNG